MLCVVAVALFTSGVAVAEAVSRVEVARELVVLTMSCVAAVALLTMDVAVGAARRRGIAAGRATVLSTDAVVLSAFCVVVVAAALTIGAATLRALWRVASSAGAAVSPALCAVVVAALIAEAVVFATWAVVVGAAAVTLPVFCAVVLETGAVALEIVPGEPAPAGAVACLTVWVAVSVTGAIVGWTAIGTGESADSAGVLPAVGITLVVPVATEPSPSAKAWESERLRRSRLSSTTSKAPK